MKIEKSGDLIFWTYFMFDWNQVRQGASEQKCISCGRPMNSVETITDSKGLQYGGVVCHNCKSLIWFRKG